MKEPVYWTTKDGIKMNVDDMDDNHVRNAFKMLLRNIVNAEAKAKEKKIREFFPNGDIAQMMVDQEVDEDFDYTPYHEDWMWK